MVQIHELQSLIEQGDFLHNQEECASIFSTFSNLFMQPEALNTLSFENKVQLVNTYFRFSAYTRHWAAYSPWLNNIGEFDKTHINQCATLLADIASHPIFRWENHRNVSQKLLQINHYLMRHARNLLGQVRDVPSWASYRCPLSV